MDNSKAIQQWTLEMADHIHLVPCHLQDGITHHCLAGRPTGSFLTAVLCNDLFQAVCRGDDQSLAGLKSTVQFLHNYAPPGCWGSPAKCANWISHGGLIGAVG